MSGSSGARSASGRRTTRLVLSAAAVIGVIAVVVSAIVFAKGYDAQQVARQEPGVWVYRDAGQYARFDTALGQIDTVRDVEDPRGVLQSGASGMVLTDGMRKRWTIDAADPAALVSSSTDEAASDTTQDGGGTNAQATAQNTPTGTRDVVSSGAWSAYLTEAGKVYIARIGGTSAATTPVEIDPTARPGSTSSYVATAIAISDDGEVALYSSKEGAIRTYQASSGGFVGGKQQVTSAPKTSDVLLTLVGGRWVLAQPGHGRVWIQGRSTPVSARLGADATAEQGTSKGDRAYFSDGSGLLEVRISDGSARRVAAGSGTPASPVVVDGTVYAAWLAQGGGTLWSSAGTTKTLTVPDGALGRAQSIAPVIASNGDRAVLEETGTGLLWSVPDGTAVPLSQWTVDRDRTTQQAGTVQVPDVTEEKPPVAVADSFGVRPGATAMLPVLLNDYDPNKRDVLTIVPGSLSGLSVAGFGSLSLAADDQQIVIDVGAQSGTASFTYVVTDGQETSAPATVSLHVVPAGQSDPPQWCGVAECRQSWPSATLTPGGTTVVPVLDGWVDPQSDPIVLSAATEDDPRGPLTVVPTADGSVAIRHNDPNAGPGSYAITVTVTDAGGASTTKELTVSVADDSALTATTFAVVGRTGEPSTVPIGGHVRGGSGSYRLVDAVAADTQSDAVTVRPNVAAGTMQLTASKAGEYVVSYTVEDAQTSAEQTGQLRFSVADGGGAIGVPPLTAFVRPQQDTTLDVLDSVQNTTGHVLAVASASTTDRGLTVSVIDGSRLRLSGTTADGGAGRVGTVQLTVTDGDGRTATGQVTVFLTAATTGVAPIAIGDAVTVRVGELVDIPVTANDIAPRGEQLELSPQVQGSGAKGELVFASGQDVRYLAPQKPGVLTLHYSISLAGDPQRTASAAVTVTVVGANTNSPPQPQTISARAIAGQSITIPVPTSDVDADGDATVLSQVEQPKPTAGTTAVSSDGASIRYVAPAAGVPGGQVSFGYTLSDSHGGKGTGTVHVAVLGGRLADVAPVTYADSVRAVSGGKSSVTVEPLANDSDPAGGTLKLVSVVPDAPATDPAYGQLKALIAPGTDLAAGVVKLLPGTSEGVHSYIYTVRSTATSSTAQGLIVVTVAPSATAIPPTVADTVVTAVSRSQLASGIDVVTGKTQWSSGELSALTLSVWGDAASTYTVDGWRISGPDPAAGAVVPFKLSGQDASGNKVAGYGFLRIPPLDDLRLQLRSDAHALSVDEGDSLTVQLADLVETGSGDRLEQKGGSYGVQRANASCRASGSSGIVYSAGRDAPWTDSCTVLVRLVGQQTWTELPIPVTVQPKAPQAILSPISRTIAPGTTQTIDLYEDLTSWEGGRVGDQSDLDYRVSYAGGDFQVSASGRTVTVTARADAHAGARDTIDVEVPGFGGLSTTISLVVGIAPKDAPRALTFTRSCSVSAGSECTIPVIGLAGEYDPFAGKAGAGLKLVGIGQTSCQVANITTSGITSIVATWPKSAKPAGGSCIVPYTVADAQGRTGSATLTIDVQGYPAAPASITTAGFTGSTVTLMVDLGEAALAHPAVSGVAIYEHGRRVAASCSPASAGTYSCVVGGLQNGEHHQYTARAVNSVGESVDTSAVETWAYGAPTITQATAETVYVDGVTTKTVGVADVAVSAGRDTDSFTMWIDGGSKQSLDAKRGSASAELKLQPGQHSITFAPVSQYQPPVGSNNSGDAVTVSVTVAGAPIVRSAGSLTPLSNTSAAYQGFSADANSSSSGVTTLYAIYQGSAPSCTMGDDGKPVMPGGQSSPTFTGLHESENYSAQVCTANGFGVASAKDSAFVWTSTPAPAGPLSYTVSTTPTYTSASTAEYDVTAPSVPDSGPYKPYYRVYDGKFDQTAFTLTPDAAPSSPAVMYCESVGVACSAATDITAATAPTQVKVSVDSACTPAPAATDIVMSKAVGTDFSVAIAIDTDSNLITYTVTFTGAFASLQPTQFTRCL